MAYSEHSTNIVAVGYNEAYGVWSVGLHRRIPPDKSPWVPKPVVPVDPSRHGVERIWPLLSAAKGHTFILVIIDAFSRWVELYPTTTTTAVETASCIFQHFGRFGNPDVFHTDLGTAFHNEIIEELLRMTGVEQSLTTAYFSEENGSTTAGSWSGLTKKYYGISMRSCLTQGSMTDGRLNSCLWYSGS